MDCSAAVLNNLLCELIIIIISNPTLGYTHNILQHCCLTFQKQTILCFNYMKQPHCLYRHKGFHYSIAYPSQKLVYGLKVCEVTQISFGLLEAHFSNLKAFQHTIMHFLLNFRSRDGPEAHRLHILSR